MTRAEMQPVLDELGLIASLRADDEWTFWGKHNGKQFRVFAIMPGLHAMTATHLRSVLVAELEYLKSRPPLDIPRPTV